MRELWELDLKNKMHSLSNIKLHYTYTGLGKGKWKSYALPSTRKSKT